MLQRALRLAFPVVRGAMKPQQIAFGFCIKAKREQDKNQIIQKLDFLSQLCQRDKSKLGGKGIDLLRDLEMMAKQLSPYYQDLNAPQFFKVLELISESGLLDERSATHLLKRGYYLFDTKVISQDQYLTIVSFILKFDLDVDEEVLVLFADHLDKLDLATISNDSLVNVLAIITTLREHQIYESEDLNARLVGLLKEQLPVLNHNAIGEVALNCGLMQFDDRELCNTLENVILTNLDRISLNELISSSTGIFTMGDHSSKYFWDTVFKKMQDNIKNFNPDQITQIMMLILKSNNEPIVIIQEAESRFVNHFTLFDTYNRMQMYGSFARVERGTEIWKKFEEEIGSLLRELQPVEAGLLITNIIAVYPKLNEHTIRLLDEFIVKNAQTFGEGIRKVLQQRLEKYGYLKEEVKVALEPQSEWQ